MVLIGKIGPAQGYLTYAMTVLWALVGVVINQYDASTLTTGAAVLSAVPVTLVALRCAPRGRLFETAAGWGTLMLNGAKTCFKYL